MLRNVGIAIGLLAASVAGGNTLTFPVATPVHFDPFTFTWSVQRGPFVFSRWGGLSINQNASGNIHPGGLLVGYLTEDGPDQVVMQAGGQTFRLAGLTCVELSGPPGLVLVVSGVDAGGAFTVELPFDLDGQTYDTFDLLAAEPRFSAVTYVTIRVDSALVDPVQATYVIDRVQATVGQSVPGDVDCDGDVDLSDLSALLAQFGQCSGDDGFDPAADFDHNGCIDLADLSVLLAYFGS